jgi:hypothetical protein
MRHASASRKVSRGAAESAQATTSKFGVGASADQMTIARRAQKNPFKEGEDVTVKFDPDDRNVAMIFGQA